MEQQKHVIKVLEKAIKILDIYASAENSFSLDEITKRAGLSKSTAFRILKTLEKHGFLRYSQKEEMYQFSLRLLELGGIVYALVSV